MVLQILLYKKIEYFNLKPQFLRLFSLKHVTNRQL